MFAFLSRLRVPVVGAVMFVDTVTVAGLDMIRVRVTVESWLQ